ncbi:41796_t:CDS:2, partial [Gigaspora margarita]
MEEISIRTISDVVRDFNTEELIDYLERKDLKLNEDDIKILCKEKISSHSFLKLTKEKLERYGMKEGPTTVLIEFIESLSQKLRSYFSLKTLDDLKEMLRKNKVNREDITSIKQFTPVFKEINDDDDKAFCYCMDDIILKLSNMETMTNANETTRCEFISAILHASIAIAKNLTFQDIFIVLQKDISGKPHNIKIGYTQNLAQLESTFQMNKKKWTADQAFGNDYFNYIYGIVTSGTEWHFIIYTPDGIFCTSNSEYQINLSKSGIKENLDLLRSNVKRVIDIIVGLLKDRVSV